MIKISIIVPIYNIEKEVKKNLESLHSLKAKEIEFLIINDGSKDNTENVIIEYLNSIKDSRFIYYYKKNQGVSATRNFGLNHARGEYVWFIDGDDEIISKVNKLETLDYLYNISVKNNLDVLEFGFNHKLKNGQINQIRIPNSKVMTGKNFLLNMFTNNERAINIQVWHFLVKKSFLKENNIRFCERIIYGEDLLWDAYVLGIAERVMSISEICYVYYAREGSVSLNDALFIHKIKDLFYVLTELMQMLNDANFSVDNKKIIGSFLTKRYIYNLILLTSKGKKIINKDKAFSFFNNLYLDFKDKIKLKIIFDFPFKLSVYLCNMIIKLK